VNDTAKNQYRFDVFISYARTDSVQVDRLVARLRKDGFSVWFDRDEMSGGHVVLGQLADGIACSAHMIACLSDSYVDRDYTEFELQINQSFDPANRQNRTIPVLINKLTKPVPVQIRAFTYGDLTQPENYEREYRMLTALIGKTSVAPAAAPWTAPELDAGAAEALCAAALDAQAEPQVALFKARAATETLLRFLYRHEIGDAPANATLDALTEQLVVAHKLPPHIRISLGTVRTYGDFAVSEGADAQAISAESIQPGLAALKVLTNWIVSTHLRKAEDLDEWDALCSQLPPGDNPGERLIPGTRFLLRAPRLGVNRLGAVYSGRDGETRQAVTMLLAPVPKDQGDSLLEAVARLIRLNEGGIVRPLRSGRIHAAGRRIGDYAVFESVAGVRVSELQQRFPRLPALAACEIGRGIAQVLEVLHNAAPPIVHGEVGPAAVLVTNYGAVKLICMLSTAPPAVSTDDLNALSATMTSLFGVDAAPAEPVARLLDALKVCSSASEACRLLDSTCREMSGDTNLRTVVECYRNEKALPGRMEQAPAVQPDLHKATGFELVCELEIVADGAWPAGPGRVLAWEQGSRELLLARDGAVIWRDDHAMRLRKVVQAEAGRCAAAGWDGRVRCFSPDRAPACAQLDGAIGDLRFISGGWVAGTWQHTLASIGESSSIQPLPPAIEAGVYRIAATGRGELFAVADLAGSIWLYSGGRRIAGVPPLSHVRDLAFCGRRLVVLAGDCLIWIGQDGVAGTPERLAPGCNRLLAYPVESGCLLLAEDGSSWELATSGARLPYYRFPAADFGMCDVPKRVVARTGDGWAYWRDGSAPVQSWPDALSAELAADGSHLAIRLPGRVQLYMDPL
jgi:hypothetical protein